MRYKLFGSTGLRVSELCLGTMSFSDAAESARIVRAFADAGGNYLDTADAYGRGRSEELVGAAVAGDRDRFVIGTKYSLPRDPSDPNAAGNHRKNLLRALDGSLRRLGTDHVDVLWVHYWEFRTPIEETMRALDDQVRAGKVLYLGVSDAPAWVVARANAVAERHGWTPFAATQVRYSLVDRAAERELCPMARALDLAVTAWSPLGAGFLGRGGGAGAAAGAGGAAGASGAGGAGGAGGAAGATGAGGAGGAAGASGAGGAPPRRGDRHAGDARAEAIADVVRAVAGELDATPAQVALAWLMAREGVVLPLLGARTEAQLRDGLGAVGLALDAGQLARLDEISAIDLGFPHDFVTRDSLRAGDHGPIDDHRAGRWAPAG
jgi:aryl-alcohol dehydrogenase-like predicted oxidoreductase